MYALHWKHVPTTTKCDVCRSCSLTFGMQHGLMECFAWTYCKAGFFWTASRFGDSTYNNAASLSAHTCPRMLILLLMPHVFEDATGTVRIWHRHPHCVLAHASSRQNRALAAHWLTSQTTWRYHIRSTHGFIFFTFQVTFLSVLRRYLHEFRHVSLVTSHEPGGTRV